MDESPVNFTQLAASSKQFARRLLTIGENRLELLTVELQEERERLRLALLLALGVAAFGLLAALTLTAAIVMLLCDATLELLTRSSAADAHRPLRGGRDRPVSPAQRITPRLENILSHPRPASKGPRMFGKDHRLTALEAQKQMLIAESELNRPQLLHDWRTLTDEVHALATEARTFRSFVAATTTLVTGVASFWRNKTAPAPEKPSWLKTIFAGAAQLSGLWQAFRAPGPEPKDK